MTIEFFERMCDIDSDKTYVSKAKQSSMAQSFRCMQLKKKSIFVMKRNTNTTATIREPITTV